MANINHQSFWTRIAILLTSSASHEESIQKGQHKIYKLKVSHQEMWFSFSTSQRHFLYLFPCPKFSQILYICMFHFFLMPICVTLKLHLKGDISPSQQFDTRIQSQFSILQVLKLVKILHVFWALHFEVYGEGPGGHTTSLLAWQNIVQNSTLIVCPSYTYIFLTIFFMTIYCIRLQLKRGITFMTRKTSIDYKFTNLYYKYILHCPCAKGYITSFTTWT